MEKFVFNKGNLKNQVNDFSFDYKHQYDYEDEIVGDALPGAKK